MSAISQGVVVPSATFSDSSNGAYTLPPQTTSFVPTATPAPTCNKRSVLCFTTTGQLSRNYACDLVDQINPTSYLYYNLDCYPPHYDLINHGEPNLDRTVAYPGIVCPSGFTAACTTTLTLTNPTAKPTAYTGTLTQTWCCPQPAAGELNNWVCTDKDQLNPTSRLCVSQVANTAGNVLWFTAGAGAGTLYTTSAVRAEMSIRVIRAALPLGMAEQHVLNGLAGLPDTMATTGGGTSKATTTASLDGGGSNKGGTDAGTIAGIVLGCLALLGFVGLGIWMCLRYKREGREEEAKRRAEAEAEKGGLNHGRSDLCRITTEKEVSKEDVKGFGEAAASELPARWTRSPPSPSAGYPEMGTEAGAVELPTTYNFQGNQGAAVTDSPNLPASVASTEERLMNTDRGRDRGM